jgi:hypothetical protein
MSNRQSIIGFGATKIPVFEARSKFEDAKRFWVRVQHPTALDAVVVGLAVFGWTLIAGRQ